MKRNRFIYFNFYVTFFLECILFMSIGKFAYNLSDNRVISIFLCVISIHTSLRYWAMFQARKSPNRLPQPHRLAFAVLGFGVGASMLHTNGESLIAVIFIITAFINQVIHFYYEKRKLKSRD